MIQKAVSAAERKKDFHAGPHGSFPIGPAGQHLAAAWDLAGHAADPEAVRAKILAFAHEHGLMDHLPQAAQDHMKKQEVKKAKSSDIEDLFRMAFNHESMEGDTREKQRLVAFAHEHQLQHLLPDEAHGMMHDMGVPHNHDGVENHPETGMHTHTVVKALDPIAPFTGEIMKSWETGPDAYFEGWLSTPKKDMEKDVTEPEAFIEPAQNYFSKRAPVSIQHGLTYIPVGHLQKASIIRDGKVLHSFSHPTDPAEFEHLDLAGTGSGVWVRGVANEDPGRGALRKGNIGGMSFIANAAAKEPLPGGRWRYTKLDPWVESTIAAYPVNPEAVIAVIKAHGLTPPTEEHNTMGKLEEILNAALEVQTAKKAEQDAQTITKADLGEALQEFEALLLGKVGDAVQKALPSAPTSPTAEGQGRRGLVGQPQTPADERDNDPVSYLIRKGASAEPAWDDTDKELIARLTIQQLLAGLE